MKPLLEYLYRVIVILFSTTIGESITNMVSNNFIIRSNVNISNPYHTIFYIVTYQLQLNYMVLKIT